MQSPTHEFETELKRLTHARLLTVSQACARWHDIVIDTPPFWTMFELNSILWSTSSGVAKRHIAGSVFGTWAVRPDHDQNPRFPISTAVRILLQHCRRWEDAYFNEPIDGLDFSILKGNLPLIKLLQLNARDMSSSAAAQSVEFFRSAPQLDSLLVLRLLLGSIPYNQLTRLDCDGVPLAEVARAVSLMPPGSSFRLSFPISEETVLWMPFTASTIPTLHCLLSGTFRPFQAFVALGKIFASLVLPNLEELVLTSYSFFGIPCGMAALAVPKTLRV
jgi:hypothetical protein